MLKVSLRDNLFPHANSACNGDLGIHPRNIIFDRSLKYEHDITVFTDNNLDEVHDSSAKIKIAWLLESPDLHSTIYEKIKNPKIYRLFDYVLTHKKELLKLDSRFIFSPFGGCWILPNEQIIYKKSKMLSIIASKKRDLVGHKLRHEIIDRYSDKFDAVMGNGYIQIASKKEGLADYRYSIVIENCREDYWFTEKLIDCLVTGTVPIYWGCPSISKFFDTEGIIQFDECDELTSIFNKIGEKDYDNRIIAIKNNYNLAKRYTVTEDYIYDYILDKILNKKRRNIYE